MANPQKENGFTPIANELLEALANILLTAYEYKALLIIIRNTYGYKRKEWTIKKWKDFEKIGIGTSHIKRTINMLSGRDIISVSGKTIRFNKDYETWKDIDKSDYFTNKKVTSSGNFSDVDNLVENCEKVTSSGNFINENLPHEVIKKLPHEVSQVTSSGNFSNVDNEQINPNKALPNAGLQNWHESCVLKENLKKDLKETSPLNGTDLNNDYENLKAEDVLPQGEKEEDMVQVFEDTTLRWVNKLFGIEHCKKYPDESKRREIAKIKEKGCSSVTIKNTFLHWQKEIKYPSKLDEFVLNSLVSQMDKGKAFYD